MRKNMNNMLVVRRNNFLSFHKFDKKEKQKHKNVKCNGKIFTKMRKYKKKKKT